MPDPFDALHRGVRRDAHLDAPARRALLENGEEVLGEEAEICLGGLLGAYAIKGIGHIGGGRGLESSWHVLTLEVPRNLFLRQLPNAAARDHYAPLTWDWRDSSRRWC